jgi:ATP-dependent Clp protease ATP-binding subunit ClpC
VFERYTEEARSVVVMAQEEAQALRHNYVGTEHLLLGLLRLPRDSVPGQVFAGLALSSDSVRTRLRALVPGAEHPERGPIPFTPRAKRTLEMSLHEALNRSDRDIGAEHILLGLAGADKGTVAVTLLREEQIAPDQLRAAVLDAMPPQPATDPRSLPRRLVDAARQRAVVAQMPIEVDLSSQAQRLLMSAGARALDDGRRLIEIADIEQALRRRSDADDPPPQAAAG